MAQTIPHHDIEEVRGGDDLVPLPRQHLLSLQAAVEVGEEVGVVLQIIMSPKCWWVDLHIEINMLLILLLTFGSAKLWPAFSFTLLSCSLQSSTILEISLGR